MSMTHDERRERRKRIAADAATGMTVAEICKKYGVGARTVHGAAAEYGTVLSPRRLPKVNTFYILRQLLRGGRSYADIAAEADLTTQRVLQIANRAREAGFEIVSHSPGWRQAKVADAQTPETPETTS